LAWMTAVPPKMAEKKEYITGSIIIVGELFMA
jgi:hypothetical protein